MGKGRVILSLLLLFSFSMGVLGNAGPELTPSLILNNALVELKHPLLLDGDRMLISIIDLMRLFHVECERQGETGIVLRGEGIRINMQLDTDIAVAPKDGRYEVTWLEAAPRLRGKVLYLPLRYCAESLGAEVYWDQRSGCVVVSDNTWEAEEKTVQYTLLNRWELQSEPELAAWYENHHRTEGLHVLVINTDTYVLVAAGPKPTGGYGVRIKGVIEREPNQLVIEAELQKPGPNDMVTMAFTYPTALLKFPNRIFSVVDYNLTD